MEQSPTTALILNCPTIVNGTMGYPTWATGGARGIYGWPLPVVIAGSLLNTLGYHDGRPPMIPMSLIPYRY